MENDPLIFECVIRKKQVPPYISVVHLRRISDMIKKGQIHPDKPSCDMTAEIAAGVPASQALDYHFSRPNGDGSIYSGLF